MSDGQWYQVNDDGTTTPLDGPPPGWRDSWGGTSPPEEAYGRVTDPERYRVLHTAARELLDRLTTAYAVDREDGDAALDPPLTGRFTDPVEAVVRLTPRSPTAAPLTVAFTSFPGLTARFGEWVVQLLPICGCDACDDDPAVLAEQLTRDVEALVAGRFTERLTGSGDDLRIGYRLGDQELDSLHTEPRQAARAGGPAEHEWSPWPPAAR